MRSLSKNSEDWRIQRIEMEDWMTDHQIPDDLQKRICRFLEYKWIATQGVEQDSILKQLPVDLRRDIKQWLCLDLVQHVSGILVVAKIFCNNINHQLYLIFERGTKP